MPMIGYFGKAVGQLTDPRLRRVLWLGVLGAIGVFAMLWAAVWWMLGWIDPSSIWGLGGLMEWLGETFDWIAGIAFLAGLLVATFLMFPAVVTVIVGFLLDEVAAAVEARHYPGAGDPRRQPMMEVLGSTLKFAAIVILLNLLILPVYLILFVVPPLNLILFYLLNGYLIGREYFELVAFRWLPPETATRLRRQYRARVLLAGVVLTFCMTVPVVNLFAPVLGVAFMVHVVHDIMRRAGVAGPAAPGAGE